MRNWSYLLPALFAFTIAAPKPAYSQIETLQQQACNIYTIGTTKSVLCGVAGGTWLAAGPTVVYVDFTNKSGTYTGFSLNRYSYTGTASNDSTSLNGNGGAAEATITPVNTKVNNDVWDYYFIQTDNINTGYQVIGVAIVN